MVVAIVGVFIFALGIWLDWRDGTPTLKKGEQPIEVLVVMGVGFFTFLFGVAGIHRAYKERQSTTRGHLADAPPRPQALRGAPKVSHRLVTHSSTTRDGWTGRPGEIAFDHRILTDGAVGFAHRRSHDSFYVNFDVIQRAEDVLVEVTFNPEWADLGGPDPTDVVVSWGSPGEVGEWLRGFVEEFDIELCAETLKDRARTVLFGADGLQVSDIDLDSPWALVE